MSKNDGPWGQLVEAVGHVVATAVLFVVIALVALLLGWFVRWLEQQGAPPYMVYVCTAVEYILFTVDIVLLLIGLYRAVAKVVRN